VADSPHIAILRRKARPPQPRRAADGAGEAWRRVLPRVAADGLALQLVVTGFEEREFDLHRDLAVEDGALLLLLAGDLGAPCGLAVLDPALLAGLIEVQTTGRVTAVRRDPRRPTPVDAALSRHVIDTWLAAVAEARGGAAVPVATAAALPDQRAALLKLEEGGWIETRVDLDLGGGKRSGRLRLYRQPEDAAKPVAAGPDAMRAVLVPLGTMLDAVLCRVRVPLGTVAALAPGQLVPLSGADVRRIRLEAPLGRLVAQVHLGQSRGRRAVRILSDAPEGAPKDARPVPSPEPLHGLPGPMADMEGHDYLPDLSAPGDQAGAGMALPLPGL
jgi:flagellar motor switch protein FliM